MFRLRRALVALALVAAGWSVVLCATGGFYFESHGWRLSSRDPWPPGELAAGLLVVACVLALRTGGWAQLVEDWRYWTRAPLDRGRRYGWMLPAFLVALIVGALEIHRWSGGTPLWLDEESLSLNLRDRTFGTLGGSLWLGQAAPLGWLMLGHAAVAAFGTGELVLRFWPLVFGLGLVATATWIGRRWLNWAGALTVVVLCGSSQWLAHFVFEAKHYSADTFGAILLPAVAAWAFDADSSASRRRRVVVWWSIAAAALWISNGAMLVTPALAVIVVLATWRRDGRRAALATCVAGGMWLAAFAVHYALSGRYTLHSSYLQYYWASEMPPAGLTVLGRLQWTFARLPKLAENPAGTHFWVQLWLGAAFGWLTARRGLLGLLFASTSISMLALGAAGVVPLFERLTLFGLPGLFVGIALLVDRAAATVADLWTRRRTGAGAPVVLLLPSALAFVIAAGDVAWRVGFDQYRGALDELFVSHAPIANHGIDDRAGVPWLVRRRQAGDVVLSTHLGWPAIWWYGRMPLTDPGVAAGRLADGAVFEEVRAGGGDCGNDDLRAFLHGRRRVIFYLGFPDEPPGFDMLLVRRLSEIGSITEFQRFTDLSIAAVVDLTAGPDQMGGRSIPRAGSAANSTLDGCVAVKPAVVW